MGGGSGRVWLEVVVVVVSNSEAGSWSIEYFL